MAKVPGDALIFDLSRLDDTDATFAESGSQRLVAPHPGRRVAAYIPRYRGIGMVLEDAGRKQCCCCAYLGYRIKWVLRTMMHYVALNYLTCDNILLAALDSVLRRIIEIMPNTFKYLETSPPTCT